MIPIYYDTIRMIEEEFPEMEWLLRNNKDFRGAYYFHLHSQDFDMATSKFGVSHKEWADTPSEAAWQAYSAELLRRATA